MNDLYQFFMNHYWAVLLLCVGISAVIVVIGVVAERKLNDFFIDSER